MVSEYGAKHNFSGHQNQKRGIISTNTSSKRTSPSKSESRQTKSSSTVIAEYDGYR